MRAKEPRLGHGTLMVPLKQGSFSCCSTTVGAEREGMGEQSRHTAAADTHRAAVMRAEMAVVPQAISSGTILRDEVTENLMQLGDGNSGSDEMGVVCATNWDNSGCN